MKPKTLMERPRIVQGQGRLYRADGAPLTGLRYYSFSLQPGENHLPGGAPIPGIRIIESLRVELHGREPLDLDGQELVLQRSKGRALRFVVALVRGSSPHACTLAVVVTTKTSGVRPRHA
jgi:hypothetical protein